ncbi:uncharacterized protein LOC126725014 isoform X2 [Quercus robur]|uniref:uncharacterized protein LOC126725014 isoform X2 n=1 Tax=Quercus robur TaxID=38942 RepID=UPI002163D15B|nr:uncharacterized protein LOC126725014 isoform X2 [Quercus robur]
MGMGCFDLDRTGVDSHGSDLGFFGFDFSVLWLISHGSGFDFSVLWLISHFWCVGFDFSGTKNTDLLPKTRNNAEEALQKLNGTVIGKQTVRLSWGRNPANKQFRADYGNQWSGAYYGG